MPREKLAARKTAAATTTRNRGVPSRADSEESFRSNVTAPSTDVSIDHHHLLLDSNEKTSKMDLKAVAKMAYTSWSGRKEFFKAQQHVAVILLVALIGNNWPYSYPRNDNENANMFWLANAAILVAAAATLHHDPASSSRGVQLLSRNQTEEWKGWMQWAFIMYHYWRARFVYNEIRVFVSAYVFMTGWGNFQYFNKKQDFSLERAVSMWLRINYFPLLLCLIVRTKLDDFYIVPLHTTGFFITMATCYVGKLLEPYIKNTNQRNLASIGISLLVHVLFYETPAVNFLKVFSHEIFFRFQADKYSCWVGIFVGFLWTYLKKAAQFYNTSHPPSQRQRTMTCIQIGTGCVIIFVWYGLFGHIKDKYTYNPIHPYVFWIPVAGWLTIRNASKYLMEIHCGALEFFGRITLETYVLQFHLFMCRHVQHIPIVVPGSGGVDGNIVLKLLNMLITGAVFVATAYYARQTTVTTQTTVTELLTNVVAYTKTGEWPAIDGDSEHGGDDDDEKKQIVMPLVERTKSVDEESGTEADNEATAKIKSEAV